MHGSFLMRGSSVSEIKCPSCGKVFKVDESGYAAIVSQIRNVEFQKDLDERVAQLEKAKTVELSLEKQKWDGEIEKLKSEIQLHKREQTLAVNNATSEKDKEIAEKEKHICELKSQLESAKDKLQIQKSSLISEYDTKLKAKDEIIKEKEDVIERYKDLKAKMSTKMLGETLERHCEIAFEGVRSLEFQNAYFGKDNDASTGSKGDYIFREKTEDGIEFISIMFEMKNEADTTSCKHKNEDFFEKLNKDRNDKKCEYAVLVSLLEPENELYNNGIIDVSHKYPKMYVVRPQFFIPIITLLRNAAQNSLEYRKQLVEYQKQNVDITNFENKLLEFQGKFGRNVELAKKHFDDAITEIDKTIKKLETIKEDLRLSGNNLYLANDKLQEVTIRKLTSQNPTMQRMFRESKTSNKETK